MDVKKFESLLRYSLDQLAMKLAIARGPSKTIAALKVQARLLSKANSKDELVNLLLAREEKK
jgi:hypothetical protein